MTVLMTEEKATCLQYVTNTSHVSMSRFYFRKLRFTLKLPLNSHELLQNRLDFLKCRRSRRLRKQHRLTHIHSICLRRRPYWRFWRQGRHFQNSPWLQSPPRYPSCPGTASCSEINKTIKVVKIPFQSLIVNEIVLWELTHSGYSGLTRL